MLRFVVVSLFLLVQAPSLVAAEYEHHRLKGQTLEIRTDEGKISISAHSPHAMAVWYQPKGVVQLPSYALANNKQRTRVKVKRRQGKLIFSAGHMQARITKSPLSIAFYHQDELLIAEEQGLVLTEQQRGFRFTLSPAEKLMGGGQRVLGMNRRGQRMPLYNRAHYGYETHSKQMYYSLPAVVSNKKYALVFDNSARGHMDIGHSEPEILAFEAVGGRTAYLVVAGDDYPDLLRNFTQTTGRQPLPPRWALGNFASRFGYRNQAETEATVQRFLDQDFPLDAVVLDLYWFGKDIQGHMGNLSWDKQAFPDSEGMIERFRQQGVETVVITEPFVLSSAKTWPDAVANQALAMGPDAKPKQFDFYFGNTGLIDIFSPQGRRWFARAYERLFAEGVRGWWGDLGEPEVHPADTLHRVGERQVWADLVHNAYGHKWAELVYHTHKQLSRDTRPMVMMRSGFIGTQRFGIIPWTGDVNRSWGGLKPQVELALQMSMLGLAYTHSDLGGFAGGETFDKELYIRWLQYGVFQPVYRPHAQEHIAPEPVFHDEATQDIVRRFIKLRYALLPYNYSLAYENSLTGMPLMRPMLMTDGDDKWFDESRQYLWGDAFLVRPITAPGATQANIDLPQGVWFDYWSDKAYEGNQRITLATDIHTLPVMVRAGAFIPMAASMQSTKDYDNSRLDLHYYAHPSVTNARGRMYEDDGNDPAALADKAYQTLDFEAVHAKEGLDIQLDVSGDYATAPRVRRVNLVIHNWTEAPESVRWGDASLKPLANTAQQFAQGFYHWDVEQNRLTISVTLSHKARIRVR